MIHNIGTSCAYCTLWADGFNGIYDHLVSRAAFVVSGPDRPDVQRTFAGSRNWRFPMVSHADATFAMNMGYRSKDGGLLPGDHDIPARRHAHFADIGSIVLARRRFLRPVASV